MVLLYLLPKKITIKININMKTFILSVIALSTSACMASMIYIYYCPIDRIVQSYTWPGIYKCPVCNSAMMNSARMPGEIPK